MLGSINAIFFSFNQYSISVPKEPPKENCCYLERQSSKNKTKEQVNKIQQKHVRDSEI